LLIWILNFSFLAKPLYETTKGRESLVWKRKKRNLLEKSRGHSQIPCSRPPYVMKPFFLYVHELKGTAIEVLTQLALSSGLLVKTTQCHFLRLDYLCVCPSSHSCLLAEADKLTLGQELTVWVLHSILTLMEYKGNYC
jgi:hypothetical protein